MCVSDLPEQLAIINSIGTNHTVGPSTKDDFVGKDGTKRLDTVVSFSESSVRLGNATSNNWVVVGIPKTNGSITTRSDKSVWDSGHKPNTIHWFSVTFTKKHLWEITSSKAVNETLVGCCHQLNSLWVGTQTIDSTIVLYLKFDLSIVVCSFEEDDLTITTSNSYLVVWNGNEGLDSHGAEVNREHEDSVFDLETAKISRCCSSIEEVFLVLWECEASIVSNHHTCRY